jgi:hypothetical protein
MARARKAALVLDRRGSRTLRKLYGRTPAAQLSS